MKAIRVHQHGGPDVLAYENVEIGEPGPGEVRVRNRAIGVNFVDVYLRRGSYPPPQLPFTPGKEGAGEVISVGPDVEGFEPGDRVAYAEALLPYGLWWYEEAGDPHDFALQAELAKHYERPMATGENLFAHQEARNLLRYGGMRPDRDWLQFDCALSYGLVEYMRTLDVMKELGWSTRRVVLHGGHQMSLNIAAGLHLGGNESYPDVFRPFGGFADGISVEDGYVALPQIPGATFYDRLIVGLAVIVIVVMDQLLLKRGE